MFDTEKMPEVSDRDIKMAQNLSREDYKRIKRMNKEQLIAYLRRIWARGYNAGHSVGLREAAEAERANEELEPAEKGEG